MTHRAALLTITRRLVPAVDAALEPTEFPASGLYGDGNCAQAIIAALMAAPLDKGT